MRVLSLFAGIGGIELGLERAGMTTVGQVELDPWCRTVLAKHWPAVPQHDDVVTAPEWWASTERPTVDLICGGFPCQPFSLAGKQLGTLDERWMWPAMARIIRALRPRYVLVENVSTLVRDSEAWGTVLSDLHQLGFDAEWTVVRASQFGAPHRRERVYMVAYPQSNNGPHANQPTTPWSLEFEPRGSGWESGRTHWLSEPDVGRVAYGVSRRLVYQRLHALGNSVVPQISEHIGKQIMEHARSAT